MMIFMVVIALLQLTIDSEAQDCLLASNGDRPLPNFIRTNDRTQQFRDSPIQAIITSYRFNCCALITEWRAYVERSSSFYQDGAYSISFQVWRPNSPSPVDTDGCYTLIGINRFSEIQLPDVDSSSRLRGLVNETPSVSERIEVQPGDAIGFYLTSERNNRNENGIQFADDDDDNEDPYEDETVWFTTDDIASGGPPTCQFPVGRSGTLSLSTNLAPLIRVSLSSIGCPQPTTTLVALTTFTQVTTGPNPSTEPSPLSSQVDFLTTNTFEPSVLLTSQVNSNTLLPSSLTDLPTSSPGSGLENTGLTIGVAAGSSAFVLFVLLVIIIMIVCILKKKRSINSYKPTEPVSYSTVKQETKEDNIENLYDAADLDTTDPSTINNEAYGKFSEATTSTEENLYDNIHDTPIDLTIQVSQNTAYGDIPTSTTTNDDQDYYTNEGLDETAIGHKSGKQFSTSTTINDDEDYYTNEGMNEPMTMNEAYGGMNQQNHTIRDDSSIPTRKNEAYNSVSANTDGMEIEETYDYVRNL